MKEKKVAREERNQEKLANADWVMAEFYATWCPHCQRMKPVVEEFKKLMEGTIGGGQRESGNGNAGIQISHIRVLSYISNQNDFIY